MAKRFWGTLARAATARQAGRPAVSKLSNSSNAVAGYSALLLIPASEDRHCDPHILRAPQAGNERIALISGIRMRDTPFLVMPRKAGTQGQCSKLVRTPAYQRE